MRLAAFHNGDVVRSFLTDRAIPLAGIKQGKPDDVRRLALLGGADPDQVLRNATAVDGDRWLFRGETFIARLVSRGPGHVCPLCLVDDAGSSTAPDRTRLRERFAWRFSVVTACPVHGVALVDALQGERLGGHDALTAEVADRWGLIAAAAAAPSARKPTPLQRYVLQRLDGVAGPAWLDAQRLDQAVRSCELLGAAIIGGPRPGRRRFDADSLDRAQAIGFETAAGGPVAIREVLSAMQRREGAQSGNAGPPAVFGALYGWADHASNRQSPLAEILRAHIIETMPVGSGDLVFGQPVTARHVHSVRTLGQSLGLDFQRLRKVLARAGVIAGEMLSIDDNRCVFDAAAGEAVGQTLADSLTLNGLAAALHVTLPRVQAIVEAGLIRPWLAPDPGQGLGSFAFARRDVDAFVTALLDGAEPVTEAAAGYITVDAAIRVVGVPAATLLGAILDGLCDRQRIVDAPGIMGLRLLRAAVAAQFPPHPVAAHRFLAEAAAWLAVPHPVMTELLRDRPGGPFLPTCRVPVKGRRHVRAIPEAALDAFDRQYVTTRKLARERGVFGTSLSSQVKRLNLTPAIDPELVGMSFYHRHELEAAVASLTLKPRRGGAAEAPQPQAREAAPGGAGLHPADNDGALGRRAVDAAR